MYISVLIQVVRETEFFTTDITFVRFVSCVSARVVLIVAQHIKCLGAVIAFIWLLTCQRNRHIAAGLFCGRRVVDDGCWLVGNVRVNVIFEC